MLAGTRLPAFSPTCFFCFFGLAKLVHVDLHVCEKVFATMAVDPPTPPEAPLPPPVVGVASHTADAHGPKCGGHANSFQMMLYWLWSCSRSSSSRHLVLCLCTSLATSVLWSSSVFHDCTVSAIVVIFVCFYHLGGGILLVSYVGISAIFTGNVLLSTYIDKLPAPRVASSRSWRIQSHHTNHFFIGLESTLIKQVTMQH